MTRPLSQIISAIGDDNPQDEVDVIVIGAGLAGLCAAVALHQGGKRVLVLEAASRVGGKTLSVDTSSGGRVDLGAAWLNEYTQPEVYKLSLESGNTVIRQNSTGVSVWEMGDRVFRFPEGQEPSMSEEDDADRDRVFELLDSLSTKLDLDASFAEAPMAAEHDAMTVSAWLDKASARDSTRLIMSPLIAVLLGVDMREVSLLYLLHYIKAAGGWNSLIASDKTGGQFQRTRQGNQTMSTWMAKSVLPPGTVLLDTPVSAIHHDRFARQVTIVTRTMRRLTAKRVICTVPSPLLNTIEWSPQLPVEQRLLAARSYLGITTKVILLYERAWWREAGLAGSCVSSEFPVCVVFDTCDGELQGRDQEFGIRQHSLTCFIMGDHAAKYAELAPEKRQRAVKDQLARLFDGHGDEIDNTVEVIEHQWILDEWSQGAPVPVTACGALSLYGSSHGAAHGLVHFAGTEYATRWKGYMEGAIVSGRQTAAEVLEAM